MSQLHNKSLRCSFCNNVRVYGHACECRTAWPVAKNFGLLLLRELEDEQKDAQWLADEIKAPIALVESWLAGTAYPDIRRFTEILEALTDIDAYELLGIW